MNAQPAAELNPDRDDVDSTRGEANSPADSSAASTRITGLPQLLLEDKAVHLHRQLGLNRAQRAKFGYNRAVLDWRRRRGFAGHLPDNEIVRLFYSDARQRLVLFEASLIAEKKQGDSRRVHTTKVPSLEYQILLQHFKGPFPDTFDRELILATLKDCPHAGVTPERLNALIERTDEPLRKYWVIWPQMHAQMLSWNGPVPPEKEAEFLAGCEKVILGLVLLLTLCKSLDIVRIAQAFVPELVQEFSEVRDAREPAQPRARREDAMGPADKLWDEQLLKLLDIFTTLSVGEASAEAVEPLIAQATLMRETGRRAAQEREAARGISTADFIERLRAAGEQNRARWLRALLTAAEQTWENLPVEAGQSVRVLREQAVKQIEALLKRYRQLTRERRELRQQIEKIESQMPGDLEGLRSARQQLRTLNAEVTKCDSTCEQLEQETLEILSGKRRSDAELGTLLGSDATREGDTSPEPPDTPPDSPPGGARPPNTASKASTASAANVANSSQASTAANASVASSTSGSAAAASSEPPSSSPPPPPPPPAPVEVPPPPAERGSAIAPIATAFLAPEQTRAQRSVRQADLLWALVDRGQLLSSHWYLDSLRTAGLAWPDLPPAPLFRVAALASFVCDETSLAADTYRDTLLTLDLEQLQRIFEERKTIGQYAVGLAASLQPALFYPASGAPQLLRASNHDLPPDLSSLLTDIVSLGDQSIHFTLFDFGGYAQDVDVAVKLATLQQEAATFRTHAMFHMKGYYHAKAALRKALGEGELGTIVDAVIENRTADVEEVRALVTKYRTREALEALLKDAPKAVVGGYRNNFTAQAQRCVEYGTQWLAMQKAPSAGREAEYRLERLRPTLERITTQLPLAIEHFQSAAQTARTLEDEAGCKTAVLALNSLSTTLAGHRPKHWDAQNLREWLHLPHLLAGECRDSAGEARTAAGIAEFARSNFDYARWAEHAATTGNLKLARAVLHEVERIGADADSAQALRAFVDQHCLEFSRRFEERAKAMQTRLHDAFYANLLTDQDYRTYVSLLDELQGMATSDGHIDYPLLLEELDHIAQFLDESHKTRLSQLRDSAATLRASLHSAHRQSEVPQDWLDEMERALTENNLTVAEEYIGQLRAFLEEGAFLVDLRDKGLHALTAFAGEQTAILSGLEGPSRSELALRLMAGGEIGPLKFSTPQEAAAAAMRGFERLAAAGRHRVANADFHAIYSILTAVGFGASDNYASMVRPDSAEPVGGFIYAKLRLDVGERESLIPAFGSQRSGQYHVLAATRTVTLDEIAQFIESKGISAEPVIVLLVQRMSAAERVEFWKFSHSRRLTLLAIDEVVMLYVAAQLSDVASETRLRRMMRVTLPYTCANPYIQAMQPPAPEMFFGREDTIVELLRPGGSAIIYGGRQMGKSSILQQVRRRFAAQSGQHAWYHVLDSADVETLPYDTLVARFWNHIAEDLVRAKLIAATDSNPQGAIRNLLNADPNLRLMLILDEADKFIDRDSERDFGLFRELRELVYQSGERFRVLIAGLANVQRYALMPNFPLTQLGTPAQIKVMETIDAVRMVRAPLAAMGFTFDDMGSINRILAYTNRHPGLIQVFCYHLAMHLNRRIASGEIVGPGYQINDRDISATYEKREVRQEIVERFNMTLRLDPHYPVIAYGLIMQGVVLREFSLPEAAEIGRQFWPEEFGDGMSNSKLRAILDEMVGLGVLVASHNLSTGENLYRLASTNVLRLLGSEQDMRKELTDIRHARHLRNPMQYHRVIDERSGREGGARTRLQRSPFTVGDELQIAGFQGGPQVRARHEDKRLFTVSLVFGSKAAGLEEVRRGLESLHYIERDNSKPYGWRTVTAEKTRSLTELHALTEGLGSRGVEPHILHIEMPGDAGDPGLHREILERVHTLRPQSAQGTLRVVLSFGPLATWQWLSSRRRLALPEEIVNVHMVPWTRSALRVLLADMEMMDSQRHIELLLGETGGWFYFLRPFMRAAGSMPTTDDPEKVFAAMREKLSTLKPPAARTALSAFGIFDIPQVAGVFYKLLEQQLHQKFDVEDLQILLNEKEESAALSAATLLAWGLRLGLFILIGAENNTERYRIDPAVITLLERSHEPSGRLAA
jgi:hypothetical protein